MSEKKYKIEFHIHTSASHDSILSKYFLFFMCKLKHVNCIAITDHNEIKGALKYKPFFEKKGINVIVGEEIFTKDGEIIGLYLEKRIEEGLSVEQTIKEIKKQNGLIYIPHPYDAKRYKTVLDFEILKKFRDDIDFIECHNGRNVLDEYSVKQNKIADELNLRKIIGSDAHTFYEVGRNYCLVNSLERNDLKTEIENAVFIKKKCISVCHFNTKIARVINMVKGGKWNELSRCINKKVKKFK